MYYSNFLYQKYSSTYFYLVDGQLTSYCLNNQTF